MNPAMAQAVNNIIKPIETTAITGKSSVSLRAGAGTNVGSDGKYVGDGV